MMFTTLRKRYPNRPTTVWALLLMVILSTGLPSSAAQAEGFSQSQIKAVYIYNFANFIRWGSESFVAHPDEFHFCAYKSKNEVVSALKEIINGEQVNDRQLILRIVSTDTPPSDCQILFVEPTTENPHQVSQPNLLTVSEQLNFGFNGGIIELKLKANRIRPRVHLDHLQRAGLSASSQLLRISERLTDKDTGAIK